MVFNSLNPLPILLYCRSVWYHFVIRHICWLPPVPNMVKFLIRLAHKLVKILPTFQKYGSFEINETNKKTIYNTVKIRHLHKVTYLLQKHIIFTCFHKNCIWLSSSQTSLHKIIIIKICILFIRISCRMLCLINVFFFLENVSLPPWNSLQDSIF